jgi:hypothetical protein
MPFPLIPTALGVGFLLVWVLIAGMIFRDGQLAARRDRESPSSILPLAPNRPARARTTGANKARHGYQKSRVRVAS